MRKLIASALILACIAVLTQCAADYHDSEITTDNIQTKLAPDEVKAAIVGIWHNDDQPYSREWAYNYHTIFYDDFTVEHYGHRNVDAGTYTIDEDGTIRAIFDRCEPEKAILKHSDLNAAINLLTGGCIANQPKGTALFLTTMTTQFPS